MQAPLTEESSKVETVYRYVVVGAGPAGVTAVENLRRHDPEGTILLIGGEQEPPYSRMAIPYMLVGKVGEEGTYLRQQENHFPNLDVKYQHAMVLHIDAATKRIKLNDGSSIQYEKLCLATGARPIKPPIPGLDQKGVRHCWTLDDARKIIELAHEGADVVLMGAGFIGCIILEALALRGVNLTVVEMGDRMVPRMLDPVAGTMLKRWCEEKGVTVHTSTRITQLESNPGETEDTLLVDLDNGEKIPAHLVVVAAGVKSNLDYLEGSGLATDQGILVNEYLQTSDEHIFAIGDVAQGPDFEHGDRVVHAIQPTATDHGRIAALNMVGKRTRYQGSMQMNVLDTLGLISVSFGEWDGRDKCDQAIMCNETGFQYMRLEFADDRLVGAQCVGRTAHIGVIRGLIEGRVPLGAWKEKLKMNPYLIMDAYLSCAQS
ncbi:MAG: NAD(P)/FAD-dependent oxidoreductase [Sedimenticola thiotaurini]|uniref:NAD(P)/FAD-dependent oxidoreductase n=1 Tax=Sedimenticola thiotaurini TaxID=1543721 RepID=A0A558D6P8_9GAMM|nr:MAG: NAD(P)/FAD-dependent oxidoreductase [Sedimenticola thiotaurini]